MSLASTLQQRWSQRRVPAPHRGPAARMAEPAGVAARGLCFTEWMFFSVFALALLFAVSTPVFGTKLFITGISHAPLALLGPVLVLHLVGKSVNGSAPFLGPALGATWPLVALGLFALVGSLLAKYEYRVIDTYFSFAVYTLLLPLYVAAVPGQAARVRHWARAVIVLFGVFALASLAGEAIRYQGSEALHEIEYLVASGFFLVYLAVRHWGVKVLVLVLLVAAAVLNRKLTGYIITVLALVHVAASAGWRNLLPRSRPLYAVVAVVLTLLLAAVLGLLYVEFRQYLPSGNVDVRLRQYEAAWAAFLKSPIYGYAFLQGSGEDFREFVRLLNIPTHSDVLDILKHGGLIGLVLFLWGYVKLFRLIQRAVAATRDDHLLHAYFVGMRFFQFTAFITFLINPVLLKGPFLVVIWGGLGIAAGIAMCILRDRASSAAAAPAAGSVQ